MWNLEKDPHLSADVRQRHPLRRRARPSTGSGPACSRASRVVPRLRQRVGAGARPASPRRSGSTTPTSTSTSTSATSALRRPGTERQLLDLAAAAGRRPVRPHRPLWEFTVIDGLADGRGAMVQKMHHTITDGEGGVRMSVQFIDLERDPAEPDGGPGRRRRRRQPSDGRPLLDARGDGAGPQPAPPGRHRPPGVGGDGGHARHARPPGRAPGRRGATSLARSPARSRHRRAPLTAVAASAPSAGTSTCCGCRSTTPRRRRRRSAAASTTSSSPARPAGPAPTTGQGRRRSTSCACRCRSAPAPTRSAGGNAFTPTRVLVPTGPDPGSASPRSSDRLSVTKEERAVGLAERSPAWSTSSRPRCWSAWPASRSTTVDFTTSNVRGAPLDLYIAGRADRGQLPARAAGRHRVQPHDHVLQRQPRHGPARRPRRDRGSGRCLKTCIEESFDELLELA